MPSEILLTEAAHEPDSRVTPTEMGQCASCEGWFPLVWLTAKVKGLAGHACDLLKAEGLI